MPAPAPNTYPFDGSGVATTNAIAAEIQTLTVVNYRDYHYVVPNFAPFFAESLVVRFRSDPVDQFVDLTEGIDYYPALQYIGASRATGKPVYGAISFNNLTLNGEVEISYQTVGGEWTLDIPKLTEITANIIHNPRTTTWESITNPPDHFPPLAHAWQLDDMVGQQEILEALDGIEQAILAGDADADLLNHISNFGNPHRVTKQQVGLGRVQNYSPATIAETIAAQSSQLYVTPIGLKAYIDSLGLDQTLNFVSLQEVVDKAPVAKILTFDLFLEYMKLYGDGDTTVIPPGAGEPIVVYPLEQGTYVKDQIFKVNTFAATTPGTINRIINITGTGSHTVPVGTGLVKITGRGGIGGVVTQPFITKTEVLNGTGNGTFTIPAGGNILSIRGRGAAGASGRTKKYSINPSSVSFTLHSSNTSTVSSTGTLLNINTVQNIEFGSAFTLVATLSIYQTYNDGTGDVSRTVEGTVTINVLENDNGTTHGVTSGSDGQYWIKTGADLTSTHEGLAFAQLTPVNFVLNGSTTPIPGIDPLKITGSFQMTRQTGNETITGANASTTIAGAVRTYSGSSTTSSPTSRTDEVVLNPASSTVVTYSSPPGTELELIYQDYNATGLWEIKRYYSSKITNPTSGTATLLEDTDGSVVALPSTSTGEYLSTRTSAVLEPTTSIPTAYALQLVAAVSNSTRRVFEYKYVLTGTEVTIRIVAELIANSGTPSQGPSATVTLMGTTQTYAGSQDNNTVPQTRTDEVILNTAVETVISYDCPVGTSVVLNYNEPNTVAPITHSDTVWEVATSTTFNSTTIVEGTVVGKGTAFTLTNWKPTSTNVLVNNTDYYVRVKWIKSDASESNWSEIKRFTYSTGVTYPIRDTELSRFCRGVDQWGTFADGTGGSYEKEISKNAVACGYVPPPPPSTEDTTTITSVQLISSLSTIPIGGTSVITATIAGTIAARQYKIEYWLKLSSAPDSSYIKSTHPDLTKTFAGSAATSIITLPLAHDGITSGGYNGKVIVTEVGRAVNAKESNVITVTFAQPTANVNIKDLVFSADKTVLNQGDVLTRNIRFTALALNNTYRIEYYQRPAGSTEWSQFNNPANPASVTTSTASVNVNWTDQYNVPVPATLTYEYRVILVNVSNATDTATSNVITYTRNALAAAVVMTISTTHNNISVGTPERITVSMNNGTPNTTYPIRVVAQQNFAVIGGTAPITVSFNITTNSSGTATHTFDGGNNGSVPAGEYLTYAEVVGASPAVKSNTISRTFAAAPVVNNAAVTCNAQPNSISVGQSSNVSANLTGFAANTQYTIKWWWTPPGQARQPWLTYGGQQHSTTITTNTSGAGVSTWVAGNDGNQTAGNATFDVKVYNTSGLEVSTPGGNAASSITFVKNTSISFTSTLGVTPIVDVNAAETLTVTLTAGPVNSSVLCAMRARFVSGTAPSGLLEYYDTNFTINTNAQGNGTANVTAGNANGVIPGPSVWSRQAVVLSSGVVSSLMTATFRPAAGPATPGLQAVIIQVPIPIPNVGTFFYPFIGVQNHVIGRQYGATYYRRSGNTGPWTNISGQMPLTSIRFTPTAENAGTVIDKAALDSGISGNYSYYVNVFDTTNLSINVDSPVESRTVGT